MKIPGAISNCTRNNLRCDKAACSPAGNGTVCVPALGAAILKLQLHLLGHHCHKMARRLASREAVAVTSCVPLGCVLGLALMRHPVDVLLCPLGSAAADLLGSEHPVGATAAAGRFRLPFVPGLLHKLLALLLASAFGATALKAANCISTSPTLASSSKPAWGAAL
jgi:hypothetical protein